jgi:hypothetical protein
MLLSLPEGEGSIAGGDNVVTGLPAARLFVSVAAIGESEPITELRER